MRFYFIFAVLLFNLSFAEDVFVPFHGILLKKDKITFYKENCNALEIESISNETDLSNAQFLKLNNGHIYQILQSYVYLDKGKSVLVCEKINSILTDGYHIHAIRIK